MNAKSYDVMSIWNALVGRLYAQSLMPNEILIVIKDVINIIGDGGYFTVTYVNQQLQRLGWSGAILDEGSFELILFLLENEYLFEVERHNLH
jgi:hypothetical protein